ncbi:MAG: hypothetical protein D6689_16545 [Deltaproteobacteria bacterium]|nr:MAG: hypothetical protein D6689_16545 [Deltaproteobacteria bacterium]
MLCVCVVLAAAQAAAPEIAAAGGDGDCLRALDALGVRYRTVRRKLVRTAVEVRGPLGGVDYRGYRDGPLVLDCSLVYSLARVGPLLRAAGVTAATYSSAYQIRNIRGTNRRSRHSYGLAIDLHAFHTDRLGVVTVRDDYEQGLGDNVDCIGEPLTAAGALLRRLDCQLVRSRLFRIVLTPDYDAGHYNHFHVEALPWSERDDVR